MAYKHGVEARQVRTSISTPVEAPSGIPFVVGTAPVHTVGGKVNEPILAYTYAEAVEMLGYSDDWDKYSLCEMMFAHFKLYGVSPLTMVNVLNPAVNKKSVAESLYTIIDRKVKLPFEAINDATLIVRDPAANARAAKYSVVMSAIAFDQTPTINTNFRIQFGEDEAASVNCSTGATVPSTSEDFINLLAGTSFTYGGKTWSAAIVGSRVTYTADAGGVVDAIGGTIKIFGIDASLVEHEIGIDPASYTATFTQGTSGNAEKDVDYGTFYDYEDETGLVVEILDGGTLTGLTELAIAYTSIDFTNIDKNDIIGGFNPTTKKSSGLELVDAVFPKYAIVPDLILAPGYSHDAEVAAVMAAKAESVNGRFLAKALIDVDTTVVKHYTDVTLWKSKQNISSKEQLLFFPKVKLAERVFHLSVHAAGLMAEVDNANGGCPAESPSNKVLKANGAVLDDGTEVLLDVTQANYLNMNGVVTTLNFIGGMRLWGNQSACYPANTDVKDYMIPISRMFGWVGNSVILSYWSRVDEKMTRRFVDSVIDSINIWLNGLTSQEKLLGGRVEFRRDENPITSLMAGTAVFHIFLTPPSPAQELEFVLEYDVGYLETLFS